MNVPNSEAITRALDQAVAELLSADLEKILTERDRGHCLQVTDLPATLMTRVAQSLRERNTNAEVFVLTNDTPREGEITSTRLVARRNAEEAVILVFLPPDLRTSAEDSFDVSTFERVPLKDVYPRLRKQFEDAIPLKHQALAKEIIREAIYDSDVAVCRYLLAVRAMKNSAQALGLALPYLGLVPDAALPAEPRPRLDANREAVRTLTNPRNSLFEKIQTLGLKAGRTPNALYRLFRASGTLDPTRWLFEIFDDAYISDLTFDQWEFARVVQGQIDQILFKDITPLKRERDQEYPIFRAQQDKALKIVWETVPPPLQCEGLNYFTIELMQDDAPATEARTVKRGTSNRKERSTTFKDLTKYDLEEGLYYVRVSAWGEGGRLIKDSKSESFFIESIPIESDGASTSEETPARRIAVTSVYEAKLRAQVNLRARDQDVRELNPALQWLTPERRMGGRYTDEFTITFNADNQFILPVNAQLRRHEHETLHDAENLGRWQLDLTTPRSAALMPELQDFRGIQIERLEQFLTVRRALFEKIRSANPNDIETLVETTDLFPFAVDILEYARAYFDALRQIQREMENAAPTTRAALLAANTQLTNIDTIQLKLPEGQTAALMAPTHPLKMLWVLQYARAAAQWQAQILEQPKAQVTWSAFDVFVPRLMSLNLPHALRDENGATLINAENMGPFWSIFVPAETRDVRTMVGRIKTLLGSPEADERFTTITGADLARKVLSYLDQHPYVNTLIVNAIQPGSGSILQELLLGLETKREGLNYKLHLFADDFDPEELGAALDEMMSPLEKRSGSDALDAFITPSGSALFPKLVYSKHRLTEFFTRPHDFEAHITFLFDAFSVQTEFAPPMPYRRSNYLYGLVNQYANHFGTGDTQVAWQRQMLFRRGLDVDTELEGHQVLVELAKQHNMLVNTFAQSEINSNALTLRLDLGPQDKNLVSQAHQVSDWVVTVDPNFGVEYLDSPYDEHCAAYLIDYQPEYLGAVGHRLIISTQHLYEIEQIVQPALAEMSLLNGQDETREFVNALRSVSGRLVLKLIASPQMARAALSMAAARLFMEQADLLQDMVLVPLDSHPELFVTARREAEQLGQTLSLRRTDMALVEMDTQARELVFHLVEVKFRAQAGGAALGDLKAEIAEQLENSAQAIRQLYDPELRDSDRVDRLVRTQELATLLDFYLERAERYRLIPSTNLAPLRAFLENLEDGYQLRISKAGIVFNLQAQGYRAEMQDEVNYHLLGRDVLDQLVADARSFTLTRAKLQSKTLFTDTRKTFTKRSTRAEYPREAEQEESAPAEAEKPPAPEIEHAPEPVAPEPIVVAIMQSQLACDVLLGARQVTKQFGLLGRANSRTVALDLNGTNVISLFGVPGSGKSYTLGNILEMAVMPIPGINQLPQPLGAVVFHYDKESYRPEFITMREANEGSDADGLRELYHAAPQGVSDMLVLVPEGKLAQRQREFSNLNVRPILFDTSELDLDDWKFLMGVVGSDALYIRKMEQVFRKLRDKLNITALMQGIASANMNATQFELAKTRLNFAKEFIRDGQFLRDMLVPGRLVIVDLRDELVEKEQALGLFVVMLKILANAKSQGRSFNKLVVFDEAHKYLGTHLASEVQSVVRQMRHLGTTVLIASQDPPSIPNQIIELSSQIILHKFNSPQWLQHLQKSNIALKELSAGRLNMLNKGQAYIWSSEATDAIFSTRPVQIEMRPRVTKHGGETITAL